METHIMIDIEALGLRAGSAIVEIGAVAFCPESRKILPGRFEAIVEPQVPFSVDLDTLEWHRRHGTWPRPFAEEGHSIGSALAGLGEWVECRGDVAAFWSWGATYDFPLLAAAFDFAGVASPWKYWNCRCARTVWQLAFGDRRADARPHRAVEDATAAARDLMESMASLGKGGNL